MKQPIVLSHLAHLWLIDIDGTIVKHNGHLESGDELLPGVKAFWDQIPEGDHIVLLTARDQAYTDQTVELLRVNDLRYNQILFGLPTGDDRNKRSETEWVMYRACHFHTKRLRLS